jgi:hypothetical protein
VKLKKLKLSIIATMQRMSSWHLLFYLCLIGTCHGFLATTPLTMKRQATFSDVYCITSLGLVPIRNFRSDFTFLDQSDSERGCFDNDGRLTGNGDGYELCVVQEEDLPDVARFIVNSFGADVISLSTDLSSIERALMHPTVGLLNAYSGLVAYAEVLSGLQSRTKVRLENVNVSPPKLSGSREQKLKEAARSSLVLAVGRASKGSDWRIDVIASVELRLEVCMCFECLLYFSTVIVLFEALTHTIPLILSR